MRTCEDKRQVNQTTQRQMRENHGFINVRFSYFSENDQ